jgi:hypothetical protein
MILEDRHEQSERGERLLAARKHQHVLRLVLNLRTSAASLVYKYRGFPHCSVLVQR